LPQQGEWGSLNGVHEGATGVGAGDSWTPLVRDADTGLPGARERLFSALYNELHQLAERQLRRLAGSTVSATTLLHETYLGIMQGQAEFPDRGRFMAYAARAMRGLIVDFARQRRALKRGAEFQFTQLDSQANEQHGDESGGTPEVIRLSEALEALAARDPRLAEVVDLKYFCGFSFAEIGAMRGSSERTVQRDWDKARLFLYGELNEGPDP
jgi:RNA polymerase sigma factor (TIGR02999 family)